MDAIATNDELTVEAWVNADDLSSSIADKSVIGRNAQFNLNFESSNDKIEWLVYIGGSFQTLSSNTLYTSLTAGKYIHVAGTWDGTTMKLYIDGKLDAQSTPSGSMSDFSTDILIGGYRAGNEKHWDGIISKCSVWSKALTEAQIRTQMFYDYTAINADDTNFNDTLMGNLVGWWQFDEGTGTSTLDSTSNDNDGTLSSAAWATAGTFTAGTSTLVMAKSGTQSIAYTHLDNDFDSLTINAGSTTQMLSVGESGGNALQDINEDLTVNGILKSHPDTTSSRIRIRDPSATFTVGSSVKTTALADLARLGFNGVGTFNVPEFTTKFIDITSSGTQVSASGDLTITSELQLASGTTFNANTNTINVKNTDVNGGTLDLRNSTLNFYTGASDTWTMSSTSTLTTGNTTVTGDSTKTPTNIPESAGGGFEIVGDVSNLDVTGDLTVIGSVTNCTGNIRQFHHTLDTQQLLDADEAGDDDLRLEKPTLDNANELQTG